MCVKGGTLLLLQALLDDIKAMTREDSDAASSDSSQTQGKMPFLLPQTHRADSLSSLLPKAHVSAPARRDVPFSQHHPNRVLSSISAVEQSIQAKPYIGEGFRIKQQQQAEEEGQADRDEQLLSGRTDSVELAGDPDMDGWDDMDPMAMLSRSVQSLARVPDAEPESGELTQVSRNETQRSMHHQGLRTQSSQAVLLRQQGEHSREDDTSPDTHLDGDASPHVTRTQPNDAAAPHKLPSLANMPAESGHSHSEAVMSDSGAQDTNTSADSVHYRATNGIGPHLEVAEQSQQLPMLTADSAWSEVESVLGEGDRAVIHSRGPGMVPFGPTMVHGYPGIVFEVTQAGRIASVTLFKV